MRLARLLALAACLVLTACSAPPGRHAAQAACDAYAKTVTTAAQGDAARAAAQKDADLAASADPSWSALQRDIKDVYALAAANAAAHNAGHVVDQEKMNAYVAADKRVRADCASAGRDLGPLQP